MASTGSIYVHCDWHAGHYLKVLMDEIFGYENFQREIIWAFDTVSGYKSTANNWVRSHDTILFYTKSTDPQDFIKQYLPYKSDYVARFKPDSTGRLYRDDRSGGRVQYLDESPGRVIGDVWDDVMSFQQASTSSEYIKYPTQKPIALIQRILAASSKPGDVILDCFCGSGTTAVAAEKMKDKNGKPAPRRWIAIDCGKFAVHITRKRLIEADACPFAVENIGFYTRNGEWKDIWKGNTSAKNYRAALVEVYGGATVNDFTYLHGRKGARWIHVCDFNKPIVDAQMACIAQEAASTDTHAIDILTPDIPIDWNKGDIEARYDVKIYAHIIPQIAIEAARERIKRKRRHDPSLLPAPDIEVRAETSPHGKEGATVTVKLTRLTIDLEDCLSTQNADKRAAIIAQLTDWRALIDYWAVDWDYNGECFRNDWQTFRTRKNKDIAVQAAHDYAGASGDRHIAVKVTDIFGNDGLKVICITL